MGNDFSNEAVLLRFIMDMFKEQHQTDVMMIDDDLLLTNLSSSNTVSSRHPSEAADAETTDQEQLLLLMPIWAYQSAAVYLIFISVFGLLMNIVVVIVIINDPQVYIIDDESSCLSHVCLNGFDHTSLSSCVKTDAVNCLSRSAYYMQ